jgi:methylthioribose-1-phosphate isomerase
VLPKTIEIKDKQVYLIDQTLIPQSLEIIEIKSIEEMYFAIQTMQVRGAPAIGVAAAAGMALYVESLVDNGYVDCDAIARAGKYLNEARPTAVNLYWAIKKVVDYAKTFSDLNEFKEQVWNYVRELAEDDIKTNKAIGRNGADLFDGKKKNILTHCNAGSLATVYWGTALGVVRELQSRNQLEMVYSDETRPRLQGGKITTWELLQDEIPVTTLTDNMAAHAMYLGKIDAVVVGADRIASNGDAANKIGTYGLAIIAKHHNIPFYVAAPVSTIDFNIQTGQEIPIEERDHEEVTHINGVNVIPKDVHIFNPGFDVTPHELITGIITEEKVITNNFAEEIKALRR